MFIITSDNTVDFKFSNTLDEVTEKQNEVKCSLIPLFTLVITDFYLDDGMYREYDGLSVQ